MLGPQGLSDHGTFSRHLRVHADRSGYYRGLEWIETMRVDRLTRWMGRKGESGDNVPRDGFIGLTKAEMFYERM